MAHNDIILADASQITGVKNNLGVQMTCSELLSWLQSHINSNINWFVCPLNTNNSYMPVWTFTNQLEEPTDTFYICNSEYLSINPQAIGLSYGDTFSRIQNGTEHNIINGNRQSYSSFSLTERTVSGVKYGWFQYTLPNDTLIFYTTVTINNLYYNGNPLITYNWKSVSAISGQMGILSLTMIEDEKIEDGDGGLTDLPESNISRFTDQTNIRRLCLNFTKNEWHRVAESGLNYLELKYDFYTVGGITSLLVDFRFVNHYGEGNNQYYSTVYSGQLPLGLQTSGNYDQYIAFIIDEENEVAQFDPVTWCKDYAHTPPITGVRYGYLSPSNQEMAALYYWLKGSPEEIDEDDPYADGSEGDGGDGNPYQPQDHIGLSSKPTKSGLNLGVVTLYKPTETEIALIADFLWSDNVLDNFKKYFNNFADNIMSFYVLPVSPEAAGISTKPFKVGNMTSDNASLQAVDYITDRYVDIDMGAFYLKRKWDSYLDVSPYSKLEVYLPYCGTHQLNTDEIMYPANNDGFLPVKPEQEIKLELNYRVDLVTGNIVATLLVNGENRYQFTGKCGMTIPLTGANYQNMVSGAITAGAGLAATIASGGLTAPLTASAAVSGTVMAQKPEVYRSGNLSGDVSMLAYDTPYLIKTIPNKPALDKQELYTGYPSYKKATLGSFSGYTEVIEAHIDDVSCSSEEKDKIMAALKGGVII